MADGFGKRLGRAPEHSDPLFDVRLPDIIRDLPQVEVQSALRGQPAVWTVPPDAHSVGQVERPIDNDYATPVGEPRVQRRRLHELVSKRADPFDFHGAALENGRHGIGPGSVQRPDRDGHQCPLACGCLTRRPDDQLASLLACTDTTAPEEYPDLAGQYVGTGAWRADGLANMSVLDLTVEQEGDSIFGAGLISGVILTDEETVWYDNDYEFGGKVGVGELLSLEVSFNSGCVWNTYHGYVTAGGDLVLNGTALGTDDDCEFTGSDSEGFMYLGRVNRETGGG